MLLRPTTIIPTLRAAQLRLQYGYSNPVLFGARLLGYIAQAKAKLEAQLSENTFEDWDKDLHPKVDMVHFHVHKLVISNFTLAEWREYNNAYCL